MIKQISITTVALAAGVAIAPPPCSAGSAPRSWPRSSSVWRKLRRATAP